MDIKTLEKIGLTSNEVKVYTALLELGPSLAGKITDKSKVNRRTVYDVLESLIDKGLISYMIEANRKIFEAAHPNKLLEITRETEREVKNIIPNLIVKKNLSNKKQEAVMYRGKKGVKSIFEDILNYKQYDVFGSHGRFNQMLGPYFKLFQKRVKDKKIKCRLLVSRAIKNTEIVKHAETKYLKKDYDSPTSTILYGEKVVIITWSEEPIALLIKDKEVYHSFKNYFGIMWKIAKK